jgi:hypothetical protein
MNYLLLTLMMLAGFAFGQDVVSMQLGDSLVQFVTENPDKDKQILFINVHENEATSMQAIRAYDVRDEYPFMYLKHNGTRRISFNMDGVVYSVDPNRIFSHDGILATIQFDSVYHTKFIGKNKNSDSGLERYTITPMWNVNKAAKMTKKLSRAVLKAVKNARCIISLHNNTPDNYSILSYQPGRGEAQNARELYINPKMDPDDFIYTTSNFIFQSLKTLEINVILQDNENCIDDGSLSVYCGKHGIPYANVEAEEGHLTQQIDLITKLIGVVGLLRE